MGLTNKYFRQYILHIASNDDIDVAYLYRPLPPSHTHHFESTLSNTSSALLLDNLPASNIHLP